MTAFCFFPSIMPPGGLVKLGPSLEHAPKNPPIVNVHIAFCNNFQLPLLLPAASALSKIFCWADRRSLHWRDCPAPNSYCCTTLGSAEMTSGICHQLAVWSSCHGTGRELDSRHSKRTATQSSDSPLSIYCALGQLVHLISVIKVCINMY